MRFVFTADIHLSRYGQDEINDHTGLPERISGIKNTLYQMADYCQQNNISTMVIGGDIYHTKSIIYSMAQEILGDFIDAYPNLCFIILDGNHDLSDKGVDAISSLKVLSKYKNVMFVSHKGTLKLENILFVPYSKNLAKEISEGKTDILISHFGLSEGMLNSGISIVSEIGMKNLIGKYKVVLLGHYHKPQEIINDSIKLYYVGSPIQLDWGEKGDEKRFLVVDSTTLKVESVPTVGYKKHIELEINTENKTQILKEAKLVKDRGDYVKLIKTDSVTLDKKFEDFNVVDKSEKDVTDRGVSSTMSQDQRMKRYLEIKKIDESLHAEYLGIGLNIIEKVEKEAA
jgi:DNA repair exonuclease SbcCD nuclease subunit